MKTTMELQRELTRSKALMHLLRDRMGVVSVYEFAGRYDDLQPGASNTQDSKKWQPIFGGKQRLTARSMASLSELFPDAAKLHQDGPANLWRAMWGALEELRSVVADDLTARKSFDLALAEFEADLLLAESYGEALSLEHLAKAIALHRLHHDLLGLDRAETCWCVRRCIDDESVQAALRQFAVLDDVRAELAAVAGDPLANVAIDQRWDALERKLDWIS